MNIETIPKLIVGKNFFSMRFSVAILTLVLVCGFMANPDQWTYAQSVDWANYGQKIKQADNVRIANRPVQESSPEKPIGNVRIWEVPPPPESQSSRTLNSVIRNETQQQFQQRIDAQQQNVDRVKNVNSGNMAPGNMAPGNMAPGQKPPKDAMHQLQWNQNVIEPSLAQWWNRPATTALSPTGFQVVTPESIVMAALQHSPKLKAISREPLVREYAIDEARSRFDAEFFVDSQYDDTNDAVGNQLTVGGGLTRLKDNIWYADSGFRKKLLTGADVDISQRVGFQNSNSTFFDPQDQATSTLSINVAQPLLRGRGRIYNRSQILIAEVGTGVAWQQYLTELQSELELIVNAYWDLYYQRSVYLQKLRNVERGEKVLGILEKRKDLDSLPSQIARARAAVLIRKTELANAVRDIRNSETKLKKLIGTIDANASGELVPAESPVFAFTRRSLEEIANLALHNRPEIKDSFQRAKIAAVQTGVSRNELLPDLKLLFGAYFDALESDSGVFRSLQRQFSETTPGVYGGIKFNYQIGNRAARSRLNQNQVKLARVRDEIQQISQDVISESHIALRRLESAFETLQSSSLAIQAANQDLIQQQRRWESFGLVEGDLTEGSNPTTVLDQLLDAQQRLANAELTFSRSEQEFKSAEIGLRKSTGTLLSNQGIVFGRSSSEAIDTIEPLKESPVYPSGPAQGHGTHPNTTGRDYSPNGNFYNPHLRGTGNTSNQSPQGQFQSAPGHPGQLSPGQR